jgi:hypothetical protein
MADKEVFENQCLALEKNIPGMHKTKRLKDVDGTEIQKYILSGKTIKVYNDPLIDAVYIKSGIKIEPFFEKSAAVKREVKNQQNYLEVI